MKPKILVFIAGVCGLAFILIWGTKEKNVVTFAPLSSVEGVSHGPSVPLAAEMNHAPPVTRVVEQQGVGIYPMTPAIAQGFALKDAEATALNQLFRQKRADVLRVFSKHSQLSKLDGNGVQVSVAVPKEQADALRTGFYADMAEIIGQDRLSRFMSTENLGRFEANFEFFGTLPMVYEFEGDRPLLAQSEAVKFRTNVARSDQYGPYNSYIVGKYGLNEFQKKFGAVADVAINQQPSS